MSVQSLERGLTFPPQWKKILGGLLMVLGVFFVGCSDDANSDSVFFEGNAPIIEVRPSQVTFSRVAIGESQADQIRVSNVGTAPLTITSMKITGTGAGAFSLFVTNDVEYSNEQFLIDPQDERPFLILYSPLSLGTAEADLVIVSNDGNSPTTTIHLIAQEVGPRLQVTPKPIIIGQVTGGEIEKVDITLSNIGSAPLNITHVQLRDASNPDFYPDSSIHTRDNLPKPDAPIEVNDSFTFTLVYAPEIQGPDTNFLEVYYEVNGEQRLDEIEIDANGNKPCIRVTPAEFIDFRQATIGRVNEREITVENCGSSNLEIKGIALSSDSAEDFGLQGLPTEITEGQTLVLAKGSTRTFFTTFTPVDLDPREGRLIILSNAPNRENVTLPITGIGSFNQCPTATITSRISLGGSEFANLEELLAEPLDTLELSAEDSFDPDGDPFDIYWSIVEAPEGFRIGFTPNNRSMLTNIQLALVGTYVFDLNVIDSNGSEACEPARLTVNARSDRALIIELTWNTPGDPNQLDTGFDRGTDLDLHLIRDGGIWNAPGGAASGDCFFQTCGFDQNNNPKVDWGVPGEISDNPSLDRDDIDGGGPETISIKTPASTTGPGAFYNAPYQIGVYFYDGHLSFGPAYATVRVFFNGDQIPALVWPSNTDGAPEREMDKSGEGRVTNDANFWLVGEIDWSLDGGSGNEIDTLYESGFQ